MRLEDLRRLDLNLLTALAALLEERHVTRAAARLSLSQPAMSRALARLRALLDDPLLTRAGTELALTPRAAELVLALPEALARLEALLTPPSFDPRVATGPARIAMLDVQAAVLVPAIVQALAEEAPGVDLVLPSSGPDLAAQALDGRADLAIGVFLAPPAGLRVQTLYAERFACLLRAGHPALAAPLTPAAYAALDHLLVSTATGRAAPVDVALAELGLARRVRMRLPFFLAVGTVIAASDMIATVPAALAETFVRAGGVVRTEPPVPLPSFAIAQTWAARVDADPRSRWLRGLVRRVARAAALRG